MNQKQAALGIAIIAAGMTANEASHTISCDTAHACSPAQKAMSDEPLNQPEGATFTAATVVASNSSVTVVQLSARTAVMVKS